MLLAVYISRTPWLKFSWRVYLLLFGAMCLVDAVWCNFGLLQLPWLAVSSLLGRQLTVTGSRERPVTHEMLAQQHLPQAYTINYLPEATASMTADESLCLDASDDMPVYFHLTLNNTSPKLFKLVGEGFSGQQLEARFGGRDLSRVLSTKNNSQSHYFLPVSVPGTWRLAEVVDNSGERVNIHSEPLVVPPCPTAYFDEPELDQVCVGAEATVSARVEGVAPFELQFADRVVSVGSKGESSLQQLHVPVDFDTHAAGSQSVEIVGVRDAFSNWVNLSTSATIQVIEPPSVRAGRAELPLLGPHVALDLAVAGVDLPCTLEYSDPAGVRHTATLSSARTQLELSLEGVYILEKFHGTRCAVGTIDGPRAVRVFTPPAVRATVEFEQIQDKCSGPSGATANVQFEGTPPFTVWYETLQGGRVVDNNAHKTSDSSAKILFKPHSVGTFTYRFVAVEDAYRRAAVDDSTQQVIDEIAGARFAAHTQTSYCPDQPVSVTVDVQGKGPFTLHYQVDGKRHSLENVGTRAVLELGALKGGDHEVALVSLVDGSGCATPLQARSPRISVRKARPRARFSGDRKIKAYDAHMTLPLQLSHTSKIRVKYSLDGVNHTQTVTAESGLKITAPGVYQLLEADDGCPGVVGSEQVHVSLYERPTVEVLEQDSEICSDEFSSLVLQLSGEPPFKLWSETVDPHGRSTFEEHTTPNPKIKLPVKPRDAPGVYKTFFWVTDKLYPDSDRSRGALIVEQRVLAAPVLMHKTPGASYDLCQAPNAQRGIPIVVQGQGPFTVNYQLQDENGGRTKLHKAHIEKSGVHYLSEPFQDFSGTAQVRLTSIRDARGCSGHAIASKALVKVKTAVAPRLDIPSRNVCVGSHVHVNLRGEGPFSMSYKLNGHKHSVRTAKNFNFLATKPGEMHITGLDDAQKCPASLDEHITIHDLPSCRITRPPAYNMRQGDAAVELQFAFSGTPPFTFEYTRTVDGRVVDTQRVEGVDAYQHSIFAKDEGQYNVVSLEDAHCFISI